MLRLFCHSFPAPVRLDSLQLLLEGKRLPNRDTLCDTLVLGVLRAYKDLGSHRGLVSC